MVTGVSDGISVEEAVPLSLGIGRDAWVSAVHFNGTSPESPSPVSVEVEASDACYNMTLRGREIESVPELILPSRRGMEAVHESSKRSLTAVWGPASVKVGCNKHALKTTEIAIVGTDIIDV
jgi:hypothetical protein